MEKIKLLGASKRSKHLTFTFPKEQKIFMILRKIFKDLNFQDYVAETFGHKEDENGNINYLLEKDINGVIDRIYHFYNEFGCLIEVIFGNDKVFLIIQTEKYMQTKISEVVFKHIKN